MTKEDLIYELDTIVNAKRIYRDKSAHFVLDNPETFPFLLRILFEDKGRTSIKAAWVLELVCNEKLQLLVPYLDLFTNNLSKINNDSALRPIAKVCSFIAKADNTVTGFGKESLLSPLQKNKIIEANFDWMITNHKVAVQVYAMDTLFAFRNEFEWISHELKLILQQNINQGTSGYKAHAKKLLKQL